MFWLAVLLLLCSATRTFAQAATPAPDNDDGSGSSSQPRQYLFGNWGGERTSLASRGVTFDFFYVADLLSNPVGGLEQANTGWGRARGTMDIDFGKLMEWKGLTFHATGLWQFGGNLGADMGTLANPSGLVSAHALRLDSFWLQQALFHDRLFIRAGQFAGLDFYGNQEFGASYLIEPLDYALGNLFPTTFESFDPAATPAVELRYFPVGDFYLKSAVLAGNRDPYQQDPTGFNFKIRDTPVFVFEAGYALHAEDFSGQKSRFTQKSYPSIFKFGAAYNGGKFPNAAGIQSSGNYLIYGMANQAVYRSGAGSNRGLDATFAFDWSPNDVNRENSQITAGVRYNGPIPSRLQDGVAFGFVYTKVGDAFQSVGVPLGAPPLGSEKAIELNYALQLKPYLLWQPVFQYYWDVGGSSHIPNAAVLGFRVKADF
ncbi:MAG TPA: carbohydrate porin [Candidatus Angelobacter sp.]|nr:carbohydrate porin [Candidatus Angelobacter sp.]